MLGFGRGRRRVGSENMSEKLGIMMGKALEHFRKRQSDRAARETRAEAEAKAEAAAEAAAARERARKDHKAAEARREAEAAAASAMEQSKYASRPPMSGQSLKLADKMTASSISTSGSGSS